MTVSPAATGNGHLAFRLTRLIDRVASSRIRGRSGRTTQVSCVS
jgi:hypothetical protein